MAQIQSGSKQFIQLLDVPNTYAGSGNKIVSVKGTVDGLEFIPPAGAVTTFLSLTDTPANYTGAGGKFVVVNVAENGLEFKYYGIINVNVNTVVGQSDYTIIMDATGGIRTVLVPDATLYTGRILNIKKFDNSANVVSIVSMAFGQTIEFVPTYNLTVKGQSVTIQSDGTNWYII
jgi:hypothetical protein